MRLLNTHTGQFVDFYDISNLRYAILSHTWDPHGEQTYQDVKEIQQCNPIRAHGTFPNPLNQAEVSQQPPRPIRHPKTDTVCEYWPFISAHPRLLE